MNEAKEAPSKTILLIREMYKAKETPVDTMAFVQERKKLKEAPVYLLRVHTATYTHHRANETKTKHVCRPLLAKNTKIIT